MMNNTPYIVIICLLLVAILYTFVKDPDVKLVKVIETDSLYIVGESTHDTLWRDRIVYVPIYKTNVDTLYIDSNDVYAKGDFEIEKDSAKITGIVELEVKDSTSSDFTFSNVIIKYPIREVIITRIDTLKLTKMYEQFGLVHGPIAGPGYGLIREKFDFFVGYGFQLRFDLRF